MVPNIILIMSVSALISVVDFEVEIEGVLERFFVGIISFVLIYMSVLLYVLVFMCLLMSALMCSASTVSGLLLTSLIMRPTSVLLLSIFLIAFSMQSMQMSACVTVTTNGLMSTYVREPVLGWLILTSIESSFSR